jgi:hypothetical protein
LWNDESLILYVCGVDSSPDGLGRFRGRGGTLEIATSMRTKAFINGPGRHVGGVRFSGTDVASTLIAVRDVAAGAHAVPVSRDLTLKTCDEKNWSDGRLALGVVHAEGGNPEQFQRWTGLPF